jgi:integrase
MAIKVKVGNVALTIFQIADGRHRFEYKDLDGRVRMGTYADLKKAKDRAKSVAIRLNQGAHLLTNLTHEQELVCSAVIKQGWTMADLAEIIAERERLSALKQTTLGDAVSEFLAWKESNQRESNRNFQDLRKNCAHLAELGSLPLATLRRDDLTSLLESVTERAGPRRKNNLRASWVTLWRWARSQDYLADAITEAERIPRYAEPRQVIETATRDQLDTLLANVRTKYRAWLVLAAWAGIRSEEIKPPLHSGKRPLQWSDIDLDRGLIEIQPTTDKNGNRRVIPVADCLARELRPLFGSGAVHQADRPSKTETGRLGALVGGWRRNWLRKTRISCRVALVGPGQTALESGNSEAKIRANYLDMKSEDEARAWFQ